MSQTYSVRFKAAEDQLDAESRQYRQVKEVNDDLERKVISLQQIINKKEAQLGDAEAVAQDLIKAQEEVKRLKQDMRSKDLKLQHAEAEADYYFKTQIKIEKLVRDMRLKDSELENAKAEVKKYLQEQKVSTSDKQIMQDQEAQIHILLASAKESSNISVSQQVKLDQAKTDLNIAKGHSENFGIILTRLSRNLSSLRVDCEAIWHAVLNVRHNLEEYSKMTSAFHADVIAWRIKGDQALAATKVSKDWNRYLTTKLTDLVASSYRNTQSTMSILKGVDLDRDNIDKFIVQNVKSEEFIGQVRQPSETPETLFSEPSNKRPRLTYTSVHQGNNDFAIAQRYPMRPWRYF